jgi:hypothetical protein
MPIQPPQTTTGLRPVVSELNRSAKKMNRLFHEVPRSVRIAAIMIAAQPVIGALYTSAVYQGMISPKVWLFAFGGAVVLFAIAYAILRRSTIVRILWTIWSVGGFLLLVGKLSLLLSAAKVLLLYTVFASAWKLTSVGLLYLPTARAFFEKKAEPNQSATANALDLT